MHLFSESDLTYTRHVGTCGTDLMHPHKYLYIFCIVANSSWIPQTCLFLPNHVFLPVPSGLLSSSTITPHFMKLMLLSNFCLYQLLVDLFVHLARYVMFIVPFLETKCLHSYTFFFTHFTSPSPITPYSLSSSGTTPSPMHTHPHITHLIYAHPVTLHIRTHLSSPCTHHTMQGRGNNVTLTHSTFHQNNAHDIGSAVMFASLLYVQNRAESHHYLTEDWSVTWPN